MKIEFGFADADRDRIAEIYWEAFGSKLGRMLGPRAKALAFIAANLMPDHGFVARADTGEVQGVLGFKTYHGALIGGDMRALAAAYGWPSALVRAALLSLLERDVDNERFLLDGIAVAPEARGLGLGSALLVAVAEEAARRGYDRIRLDVIGRNDRARALYERHGFEAVDETRMGWAGHLFGFDSAITMVRTMGQQSE